MTGGVLRSHRLIMRTVTRGDDPELDRLVASLAKLMSFLVLPDAVQMIGAGAFQVSSSSV